MLKWPKKYNKSELSLNSSGLLKYNVNEQLQFYHSDYNLLWMWAVKGRDEMTWADEVNDQKKMSPHRV